MRDGGDRSTSGKCLPKLLFTEAMKFLAFRLQQFIIWLMESLLFPGNSESSRVSFIRSFLTLQMCWQSFRLENLTITVSVVLPTRWQASIWSEEISQPSFLKIFNTFSSRISPDTSKRMTTISRHFHLEYWAFAHHCLSKVVNLVNNKLLAFFVTANSVCSFEIDSLSLRTSTRTVLFIFQFAL